MFRKLNCTNILQQDYSRKNQNVRISSSQTLKNGKGRFSGLVRLNQGSLIRLDGCQRNRIAEDIPHGGHSFDHL
jgi:hypothetical protein